MLINKGYLIDFQSVENLTSQESNLKKIPDKLNEIQG